jgi:hypothetical protein
MTPEFLKLSIEEREKRILRMTNISEKYGLKVLFWGSTLGVKEHAVVVFNSNESSDNFMKFIREWQAIGTEEAGKYLDHTRTITVY